jgi:hypothetical protein
MLHLWIRMVCEYISSIYLLYQVISLNPRYTMWDSPMNHPQLEMKKHHSWWKIALSRWNPKGFQGLSEQFWYRQCWWFIGWSSFFSQESSGRSCTSKWLIEPQFVIQNIPTVGELLQWLSPSNPISWLNNRKTMDSWIYLLVNVYKKLWKKSPCLGKSHYFNGHVQ